LKNNTGRRVTDGELVRLYPGTTDSFIVAKLSEFGIIGSVSGTIQTGQIGNINLINTVDYSKIIGIPDGFTPEAHTHPYSDIEDAPNVSGLTEAFETVSKNLKSYPYVLVYGVDGLDTITYDLGGGLQVVKTFNYVATVLTTIILSGDTPAGITLTKTLSYTGPDLTGVAYS
jgi:hypothetical protein